MATTWTDNPLVAGTHKPKPVYITQLRTAINAERTRRGLAQVTFTDPTLITGTTVNRIAHIQQVRDAILAYHNLTVTNTNLTGVIIKAVHVNELRIKINALENNPKTKAAPNDCKSGCIGLCSGGCSGTTICHSQCHSDCYSDCHSDCHSVCHSNTCHSDCVSYGDFFYTGSYVDCYTYSNCYTYSDCNCGCTGCGSKDSA